ncbi:MAG: PhoH family protein [Patescibacteria group bacterium]|nr:PhoH family protein [Patescibacteria group bacterium]MDE2438880.1 PhoH family protein [Patescibacteria group bacterium]
MPKDEANKLVAKTDGHRQYIKTMANNIITFCIGPAGSGKSYSAIGYACQEFVAERFSKIIVARPAVEASPRGLGYLAGSIEEKLGPYVQPAIEHLKHFLSPSGYHAAKHDKGIYFEALEYMQGRTYDNAFLILDEAQNCTTEQIIMFVTRIGLNSKMVINGDYKQSSIGQKSGLLKIIDKIQFAQLENFGVVELSHNDIVRNPILKPFLEAMEV